MQQSKWLELSLTWAGIPLELPSHRVSPDCSFITGVQDYKRDPGRGCRNLMMCLCGFNGRVYSNLMKYLCGSSIPSLAELYCLIKLLLFLIFYKKYVYLRWQEVGRIYTAVRGDPGCRLLCTKELLRCGISETRPRLNLLQ